MSEDSLVKRYFIKLVSTIAIVGVNAIIQILLPRILSVEEYANYTFNLNTFTSVIAIANLSTGSAFISKIAKRRNEFGMIKFYASLFLGMTVLLNLGVFILHEIGILESFFENQVIVCVILALNASILINLLQSFTSLFDAYVLTKYSEPILVVQKVSIAVLVFISFYLGAFSLVGFYFIQIISIGVTCLVLSLFFYLKNKESILIYKKQSKENGKKYFSEFYTFCKPLVVALIISNVILAFSNWLLNHYGGYEEQAFYGVAWQINSLIAFVFTPIVALLQREYAIRTNNITDLKQLYEKMMKATISIVCVFACFVAVNADYTLASLFGEEYLSASAVTSLIMFYTIFQAWGQVNGAMFTATERTKIYAKITLIEQVFSVLLVYLFLCPNFIWSQGLGSIGIGIQKLVGNIFSIILCVYFNCKFLQTKFWSEYKLHFRPMISCVLLAFMTRGITKCLSVYVWGEERYFINFIFCGCLYMAIILCIVKFIPKVLGLDKELIALVIKKKN